jgi:hypothetical protein
MTKPKAKRTRIERNTPMEPESDNEYEDPPYEQPSGESSESEDSIEVVSEHSIESSEALIAKYTKNNYFDAFGYAMSINNRLNEEKSYTKYLETQNAILNKTIDKNFKLMDDYELSIKDYDALVKRHQKGYSYLEKLMFFSLAINVFLLII